MDYDLDYAFEADALQSLYAKTLYTLRESRKAMLAQYAVESEAALLDKIRGGELPEHPAYEHYLSALIIEQTRMQVRAQVLQQLSGAETEVRAEADADSDAGSGAEISVHLMLKDNVDQHYADRLSEPVRLAQDALLLAFDSGLMIEARYFSRDEYSIAWSWGEAELRIDTAPLHADCTTFPQHLHDDAGMLRADLVTEAGTECWVNFSRLIDLLLLDPLLENGRVGT